MSFFLTTKQVVEKSKTVTRRNGWDFIKVGDIVQACEKCQGLGKGGKINRLCKIKIISSQKEPLSDISKYPDDLAKEGFPDWTPDQFIEMYCKANKCKPSDLVNRIEFEYL